VKLEEFEAVNEAKDFFAAMPGGYEDAFWRILHIIIREIDKDYRNGSIEFALKCFIEKWNDLLIRSRVNKYSMKDYGACLSWILIDLLIRELEIQEVYNG
jgi:hypothetical protein